MSEPLSGALGSVQGKVTGLLSQFQSWIDGIVPPEKRATILAKVHQFATDRPVLASFIASWLTFSGLPLGLYIAFCVTVAVFALVVGLLLALLATIMFILTMAGFALMVLFPTLFFTTFCAVVVFGWGWGLWYLIKWTKKDQIFQDVGNQVKGLLGQDTTPSTTKMHGDEGQKGDETMSNGEATSNGEKAVKRHPGHKVPAGGRLKDKDTDASSKVSESVSATTGTVL